MPKNRLAIVGAFVIGGLLLFAVGLFQIADRRMLFADTFTVYAEFADIAALAGGAKVRVSGMDAGEVEQILVPSGPAGRFRVRMRVRRDLHPLIRVDSIASIQTDGLVGNKYVQIQTGSESAPPVDDQGTIRSQEPFEFADLMSRMSETIETVNAMLFDVKANLDEALEAVSSTAIEAQAVMTDVGGDVRTILASTEDISNDVSAIISGIRAGRGTVGRLIVDDSLYESARTMAADAERAVAAIRQASEEARSALADLRGEGGAVKGLTGDARQTMHAARTAMTNLAQATEALKRNFLLRGFFERRGYFSLQELSVAEYRKGALEKGNRRALRIWLGADVLFETSPDGVERLTPGGAARLDSAMASLVRYTEGNPFVVEGYAEAPTSDARYLISRRRAELVRDYLVGKFGLDPTDVTTMAMGAEAQGSPAGTRWDGVALALFVQAGEP